MTNSNNIKKIKEIFLVHGRDNDANKGMTDFLRSLNLKVIEWSEAKKDTKGTNPPVIEIVKEAIKNKAVLVLLTPDEVTFLRKWLYSDKKDSEPVVQSRPNVLFEAGLALGANPYHTVIVSMGDSRIPSDLLGLHIDRFDGTQECRKALADALEKAGCEINKNGTDWLGKAGKDDFEKSFAHQKKSNVEVERGIPAGVRIKDSPYKFKNVINDKCKRIIMTGHNFADQLKPEKGAVLIDVIKNSLDDNQELEFLIVFAPPNILNNAHELGYNDLINTSIPQFINLKYGSILSDEQKKRLSIYCLSGALSLTCFARDYDSDNGLITITPRWFTNDTGGGRMFIVIQKVDNKKIYETISKDIDKIYSEIKTHKTSMSLKEVVVQLINDGVRIDVLDEYLEKLKNADD